MTDDTRSLVRAAASVVRGPTSRAAALVTIAGYLASFGTPFAVFYAVPKILDPTNAARTSQNIIAHPGLFAAAIAAMTVNFVGDILSAWGMYILLRPVNAAWSTLVAWFRLVYTAVGLAAVLNLVTAHRLLTEPATPGVISRSLLEAHGHIALRAFQAQFEFSLILFGVYLTMLGGLMLRSEHFPKWLAAVITVDGVGWIVTEGGPYLAPTANFGFLSITSFGELALLVWLIGWGLRLRDPVLEGAG